MYQIHSINVCWLIFVKFSTLWGKKLITVLMTRELAINIPCSLGLSKNLINKKTVNLFGFTNEVKIKGLALWIRLFHQLLWWPTTNHMLEWNGKYGPLEVYIITDLSHINLKLPPHGKLMSFITNRRWNTHTASKEQIKWFNYLSCAL